MLEPECEYNLVITMNKLYKEALEKIDENLCERLSHMPEFIKILADLIAWGCRDEYPAALDLQEYLELSDEQIAAIAGDADWLYSIMKENKAQAKADEGNYL